MRQTTDGKAQRGTYRLARTAAVAVGSLALFFLTATIEERAARMLRGASLLDAVYQAILNEYVEEVSPDDLLRSGVDGMFAKLDPYAELIEERRNSEVDVLARGAYSGLGIKVRYRDGIHTVTYIYDEIRDLTNLRLGDEILRIDSTDLRATRVEDLRGLLRGEPGTSVRLLVRRPEISDSLELLVRRRAVSIDPLPLADVSDNGILYLKLTRFSRSLIDSVDVALRRAYGGNAVRGVILDVRGNPGGLLEAAVAVADNFVDPGTPIVEMRGRHPSSARSYRAKRDAIDADVPLVVLVDSRSASASEILAGALQDLDRAIVMGERTFGKGLVQTLVPLGYDAWLKLTTSRYYMPSGRCIQRYAYPEGKAAPVDTESDAPVFRTLRLRRVVRESNGILPDLSVSGDSLPPLLACLERHDAFFTFVLRYRNRTGVSTVPDLDSEIRASFHAYADSLSGCDGNPLADALRRLRSEADRHGLPPSGHQHISRLEREIKELGDMQFAGAWKTIRTRLEREFVFQLRGDRARLQIDYRNDDLVNRAREILSDAEAYEEALLRDR